MTEETPGGESNNPLEEPQNNAPSDPASSHPPGILPPLPERRAWPWAILLAFAHHVLAVLGVFALNSHPEPLNLFLFLIVGLVPLAFVLGLVLIARKRSFPGRVLMFGALYSSALVALEAAVAAGVCIFALSKSGFH
jgi:hypothetical protein